MVNLSKSYLQGLIVDNLLVYYLDESCLDGRIPASCENVPNPCENAVCPYYSDAECRVDPCNNCSHLFYDEETGTVLKCNGKRSYFVNIFSNK